MTRPVNGCPPALHVDGSERDLEIEGLFVAIGNDPRPTSCTTSCSSPPRGTIWVDGRSSRTSVDGVFAAGDVIDPTYRQAITAAGSGTVAALDVEHFSPRAVRRASPPSPKSPIDGLPDPAVV